MSPTRRFLLPTDRCGRLLLPVALIFFAACSDRNYQTDLWHHLARGRAIVESRALVNEDRFTYTVAGQPLRDVNWGWQVLFFEIYELGGLALVQTVNAAILALTMFLLVHHCWRRSGSLVSAMIVGLFTFFGLWQLLLIRPQSFSFLLFVLLLIALDAAVRNSRWLLLPPMIMALWVNVHGGFPIGLVLIGAFVLAEMIDWASGRRQLPVSAWISCLGASVLATLANPYGWGVYEYVWQTAGRASGRHIDEWLPPSLHQLTGLVWFISVIALLVLVFGAKRKPGLRELCVLGCLLPLAAGSIRMVAWWLLAAAPVLAVELADRFPRLADSAEQDRPTVGAAFTCIGLLSAMLIGVPWLERWNPALLSAGRAHRTETDLQAIADHLAAEGKTGRIFTRFAWGEYFGWSLNPRYTVFMDGRIEIIPDTVWNEYCAVTRGHVGWQEVLERYEVTHLVIDANSPYHAELLPLVRSSCQWREVFRSGDAAVFERVVLCYSPLSTGG